jgi:WD40 repeat protein
MPIDRYASAEELVADLQRFLDGREPLGRLPGPVRRVHALFQRRPLLAGGATALGCLLIASVAMAVQASLRADSSEAGRIQQVGLTESATAQAAAASRLQADQEYAVDMQDADLRRAKGDLVSAVTVLAKYDNPGAHDPRGFEWYYLRNVCRSPSPLSFSAEGRAWNRLAFASPERLAAVDQQGSLVVWDILSGQEVHRFDDHAKSVAFDRQGKYCATLSFPLEAEVRVRQAADGKLLNTFGVGQFVTSMAIHPDGDSLLTANIGDEIFLWRLPSGKRIAHMTAKRNQNGGILDIAFSPSGKYFATGHADGSAFAWDYASQGSAPRGPRRTVGPITGVSFSPDETLVASQGVGGFEPRLRSFLNGDVQVWRLDTGKVVQSIMPHLAKFTDSPLIERKDATIPFGQISPVFTPSGGRLLSTGPRTAQLWDVNSGELVEEYVGHTGLLRAVAVSPDGQHFAAADERTVRVWPALPGCKTVCSHYQGIHAIALSPDGTKVAAVCERGEGYSVGEHGQMFSRSDSRCLNVWNVATGADLAFADDVWAPMQQIAFSPDGNQVITAGSRYSLTLKAAPTPLIPAPPGRRPPRENAWLSTDASFVVRAPFRDAVATLVPTVTGKQSAPLKGHAAHITTVAISPDSTWIATGSIDKTVRLWSAADGTLRHVLARHTAEITALAFSDDSTRLATGAADRDVHVWNSADGAHEYLLHGHRREITALAFTADGARLASGSGNLPNPSSQPGEMLLWDIRTGLRLVNLQAGATSVYGGLAFSPDGRRLYASVNALGEMSPSRIVVWDAPNEE